MPSVLRLLTNKHLIASQIPILHHPLPPNVPTLPSMIPLALGNALIPGN